MIYCDPPQDEYFVRVVVNDGVVALPGCEDTQDRAGGKGEKEERQEGDENGNGKGEGGEEDGERESAPAGSCGLEAFVARVRAREAEAGRFAEICGLDEDAAAAAEAGITFLHQ